MVLLVQSTSSNQVRVESCRQGPIGTSSLRVPSNLGESITTRRVARQDLTVFTGLTYKRDVLPEEQTDVKTEQSAAPLMA